MAIQDQFAQILGRTPTPDEAAYFQKFMADGQLQEYEIVLFLPNPPPPVERSDWQIAWQKRVFLLTGLQGQSAQPRGWCVSRPPLTLAITD
jgi:hypothetical protein